MPYRRRARAPAKRRRTSGGVKRKSYPKKRATGRKRRATSRVRLNRPATMTMTKQRSRNVRTGGTRRASMGAVPRLLSDDGLRFLAVVRDPFNAPPWQITDSFGSRSAVIKNVSRFILDPNGTSNGLWGNTAALLTAGNAWSLYLQSGRGAQPAVGGMTLNSGGFLFAPHPKYPWMPLKLSAGSAVCTLWNKTAVNELTHQLQVQDVSVGGLVGVAQRYRIVSAGVRMKYIGPHGDGEIGVGYLQTTPFNPILNLACSAFGTQPAAAATVPDISPSSGYATFQSDPRTFCFRVGQDVACAIPMVDDGYLEFGEISSGGPAGSTTYPYSPFSAVPVEAQIATSYLSTLTAAAPSQVISEADIMSQTAGGRSQFMCMLQNVSTVAGGGSYEVELVQNIEYTMTSSQAILYGTNKVAADVFAREAAAEIWSKQGSQYAAARNTGTYGTGF